MTIHFFTKQETQKILTKLHEQFGINEIPGILLRIGQERIFLYQGSLNEKEIKELEKNISIERLGIYFAKIQNDEIRLSIEGVNILKGQIKNNIFELNKEQIEEWMKGKELLFEDIENFNKPKLKVNNKIPSEEYNINGTPVSEQSEPVQEWEGGNKIITKKPRRFIIMKYKGDFVGTGKASELKISNFIPKSRRLKEKG